MTVAILALQGAFIEHAHILDRLDVEHFEIRQLPDLSRPFDGLILPGGESTVIGKLLHELNLFDPLKNMIQSGLPVFGTCAGLILLAKKVHGGTVHLGTMDIAAKRNAYGRQLGSFSAAAHISGIREEEREFPLEFIRAPYIESIYDEQGVEPIVTIDKMPDGSLGKNIVGVRYKNQIGLSFHPELTGDTRCHELFLEMCGKSIAQKR